MLSLIYPMTKDSDNGRERSRQKEQFPNSKIFSAEAKVGLESKGELRKSTFIKGQKTK